MLRQFVPRAKLLNRYMSAMLPIKQTSRPARLVFTKNNKIPQMRTSAALHNNHIPPKEPHMIMQGTKKPPVSFSSLVFKNYKKHDHKKKYRHNLLAPLLLLGVASPSLSAEEEKCDIASVVSPDCPVKSFAAHPSSKGGARENIQYCLDLFIKNGLDSIGLFDINVNLAIPKNVAILKEELEKRKLKIRMSDEAVAQLQLIYKERSVEVLFNQQQLKGGLADLSLKDICFGVEPLKEGENPIPEVLSKKLNDLAEKRKVFFDEYNRLKKEKNSYSIHTFLSKLGLSKSPDQLFNDAIDALTKKLGIVNYHNPNEKKPFRDHIAVSEVTIKDGRAYLSYAHNSIEHTAYDFEGHFSAKTLATYTVPQLAGFYQDLGRVNLLHGAILLAKRDNLSSEGFSQKSYDDLKRFIDERLEVSKSSGNLTAEDFRNCFYEPVLFSKEEKFVNSLVRRPYPLEDANFKRQKLDDLTSPKNMETYKKDGMAKIFGAAFQALDLGMPKKHEQSISLNGNGFSPYFYPDHTTLIPIKEINERQIEDMRRDHDAFFLKHPTGKIESAHLIECISQPAKHKEVKEHIEKCNTKADELYAKSKASAPSVTSNSFFPKKPVAAPVSSEKLHVLRKI